MASTPLVAIESPDGSRVAFTFAADIDTTNHEIAVGGLLQGNTITYTVTSTRGVTFTFAPVLGETVWLFNGVSGTSVSTALPAWDTVAEIVSDAAIELGLISAAISDPFASTDPNILQLIGLLKSGGRKLARSREWTHLQKEYTFSTVASTSTYALPSDFKNIIPQTGWNRTTRWPLSTVSPQRWQYLKAVPVTSQLYVEFRIQGGQMVVVPTPSAVQTIAFEYISISWIKPSGQTVPTSDLPSLATDVVCFDNLLAVAMLKLAWLQAKQMDTTTAQADFDEALEQAKGADASAPILSLNGEMAVPLLGYFNIPDTGYGV